MESASSSHTDEMSFEILLAEDIRKAERMFLETHARQDSFNLLRNLCFNFKCGQYRVHRMFVYASTLAHSLHFRNIFGAVWTS